MVIGACEKTRVFGISDGVTACGFFGRGAALADFAVDSCLKTVVSWGDFLRGVAARAAPVFEN